MQNPNSLYPVLVHSEDLAHSQSTQFRSYPTLVGRCFSEATKYLKGYLHTTGSQVLGPFPLVNCRLSLNNVAFLVGPVCRAADFFVGKASGICLRSSPHC